VLVRLPSHTRAVPVLLQSDGETSLGPLFPESYDVIWALVIAAIALLVVAAFVRVARSCDLTPTARVVWVALVLLTAPLGAIAALLLVQRVKSVPASRSS